MTLIWERGGDDDKPSSSQHQDINVTLVRKPGKGLGLSVVGRRDGPGVYISALVPGGVAEGVGQLHHGDQIIKVNERDLSNSTQVNILWCLIIEISSLSSQAWKHSIPGVLKLLKFKVKRMVNNKNPWTLLI